MSSPHFCLQERYAPHNACFGCGPANGQGLRIRSMADGVSEVVTALWTPAEFHQAFPGVLAGGVIGALLDCHCNWTAAYQLMRAAGAESPPCTVTAEYAVKLLAPTPLAGPVSLEARTVEMSGRRAVVEGTLSAAGQVTASCRGTFVAVREGHPAYHRW